MCDHASVSPLYREKIETLLLPSSYMGVRKYLDPKVHTLAFHTTSYADAQCLLWCHTDSLAAALT